MLLNGISGSGAGDPDHLFDSRGILVSLRGLRQVDNIASNVSAFRPNLEMSDTIVLDRASHFVSSRRKVVDRGARYSDIRLNSFHEWRVPLRAGA